ncbi:MAG: hypothetical protein HW385_80, partial [candidate division NC10 bacterium]|nr:hypothetical protein [candidate division NC10 bacterium]
VEAEEPLTLYLTDRRQKSSGSLLFIAFSLDSMGLID